VNELLGLIPGLEGNDEAIKKALEEVQKKDNDKKDKNDKMDQEKK